MTFEPVSDTRLLTGASPQFAVSGHLIFWRAGSLWAVPFDPDHLEVGENQVLVVQRVQADTDGFAAYRVGTNGTLAYVPQPEDAGASVEASIIVVLNWLGELKRLVPVD